MSPELEVKAKELQKRIRQHNHEDLEKELQSQLINKFADFNNAVKTLNSSSYKWQNTAEIVWQQGSTRLLHYKAQNSTFKPVIFIPSLINRSYILDLSQKRSFIKFLQEQNIDCFLIDWGEPKDDELDFSIDYYITNIISRAVKQVANKTNEKPIITGYCMGGLMALASAAIEQSNISALGLIACPWDFHAKAFKRIELDAASISILENILKNKGKVPPYIIQSIFYYLHPDLIDNKFDCFANKKNNDINEFIAIEHWLNDGISMNNKIANECFINWVHYNNTKEGKWLVNKNTITPKKIDIPTIAFMSDRDKIVPIGSTKPMADNIKNCQIIKTSQGHISMVAGARAKDLTWQPFLEFIQKI